jgi:hypothetical protein
MKPTIPEVIDRFIPYYRQHGVWGSLHIVLEDGNYDDSSVLYCFERATRTGDTEGAALAEILLTMSRTQRSKLANTVPRAADRESAP